MRSVLSGVPVFKLYGEGSDWPTVDLLHCETISSRSQLYGWEIDRHRHSDLWQLLYVRRGPADLYVEGQHTRVEQPSIQLVPPMCVHGFRFQQQIEGYVLTLAAPLVGRLQDELGSCGAVLQQARCYAVAHGGQYLDTLFAAIAEEYANPAQGRDVLLRSLVCALLVWLGRQLPQGEGQQDRLPRGSQHLQRFVALVERHYHQHWPVSSYAHQLGVSTAYLNGICRQQAGQTALQLIHQRLLLEAKRLLVYTALNVNQIADQLGFSEPAYFIRFFKRLTGQTPSRLRKG
ncbi:helix-turn-helix domain-containing protein [Vogesella sp. LIG4]|uniref:helix-turn-helix domain-containing protein n=1 Tax=Vogesella sp. LIG4 TaxID=1192162 RepID=UPI00081FC38F|nr:helix-turn-helix domain-containing protein [Vogesella sp. LIG4]SCK08736.1 transcriptional regulator, AraC family [Vogesella sp. LIG4]